MLQWYVAHIAPSAGSLQLQEFRLEAAGRTEAYRMATAEAQERWGESGICRGIFPEDED